MPHTAPLLRPSSAGRRTRRVRRGQPLACARRRGVPRAERHRGRAPVQSSTGRPRGTREWCAPARRAGTRAALRSDAAASPARVVRRGTLTAALVRRMPLLRTPSPQVYHSDVPSEGEPHACGCALLPLNTKARGPAKRTEGASRGWAQRCMRPKPAPARCWHAHARAHAPRRRGHHRRGHRLFPRERAVPEIRREGCASLRTRAQRVRAAALTRLSPASPGSSDKLLIYLTLYISACLRKLESAPTLAAGQKARTPRPQLACLHRAGACSRPAAQPCAHAAKLPASR
jgi:hypothetical protein